jgi:hypothetical protein
MGEKKVRCVRENPSGLTRVECLSLAAYQIL